MASLLFPTLSTTPRRETGAYKITLHKGWNQVANPTLATLYWPVTRAFPDAYDPSPLKGLNRYDSDGGKYVHSDSLLPWRGYFAYYKGGRDTVIELRFQPVSAPPPAHTAKSGAAPTGLSLVLDLGSDRTLRLGASLKGQDGLGVEDEPRPPERNDGEGGIWSAREKHRLETDVMHWVPGATYSWRVVTGGSSHRNPEDTSAAGVGSLRLPEGYSAWAVSRTRGLRFRLLEGEAVPLKPGMTDSLDVYAGPAAELEARLALVPLTIDAFRVTVTSEGGFGIDLRLPGAARVRWTLWTLDGRARETAQLDLAEGIYHIAPGPDGRRFPAGLYVLGMEWSGTGLNGRLTRKIAIP
jgi:hypothetical protein